MLDASLAAKRAKKAEYMRVYYARNSDRVKAQTKARRERHKADPELREKWRAADKERTRRWRERNPERSRALAAARMRKHYAADPVRARHAQYRYFYGIMPEDFSAMLEKQKGVCAICETPPPEGKLLNVDHDHVTGAVRGLLCRDCNLAIGHLKEDRARILKALAYIDEHKKT